MPVRLRAHAVWLGILIAGILGLTLAPGVRADAACQVTVTDDQGGSAQTYQGVDVPSQTPTQQDLLNALVAGGFVKSGSIQLSEVTITDSCGTTTSTTTTTTTTTTSTSSTPTTTSTSSTATGTTSPTTTLTGPLTGPSTTSTTTSGLPTPTTRATTTTSSSSTTPTTAVRPSHPVQTSTTVTLLGTLPQAHHRAKTTTTHHTSPSTSTPAPTDTNPLLKAVTSGDLNLDATDTTVPDFFVESFEIPPFLLPIYQAAGIEYQVPWTVLAAINQIETDYGTDLSVSSAGAVGWMQFMPATWKRYGVDATGNGVADPYNPVDAIFAAARYLHAAGASTNLANAILAYNHADWYVESVLLRAKLIAGIPNQLVTALSDLVEGRFPVAARAHYADDSVVAQARRHAKTTHASTAVSSSTAKGAMIFSGTGAPVIAVNDGKVVALGYSKALGRFIRLQDATGNTYTYAHLGEIASHYAAPKPVRITARDIAAELAVPRVKAPTQAASAGTQLGVRVSGTTITPTATHGAAHHASTHSTHRATPPQQTAAGSGTIKARLFAHPARSASYAAGGRLQLHGGVVTNVENYFAGATLHLARNQYTLRPLRVGSIVVAGTILGHIGGRSQQAAPHLWFQIQPAGRRSPLIDPTPILDGWKLLQETDIYRANNVDAFYSADSRNPSVGQVLLMSKQQLIERVLSDPGVDIYACGRRDIAGGLVDRRVLAVLEFLSDSGLHPTVSGLVCGAGRPSIDPAGKTGESVDISAINGTPISGHQGAGSITAEAIRRLLSLQGLMAPDVIVSDTPMHGQSTVLALPDHTNRIQVSFTPYYGADRKVSAEADEYLKPGQWTKLIAQIGTITEPTVPVGPSRYSIKR